MKSKFLLIFLIINLTSCLITEKLKTQRIDFITGAFETDGYYYTKPNKNNSYSSRCYIFYRNGVFFGGFGVGKSKTDIEEFLLNKERVNQSRNLTYSWGVFQVHNDTIEFEKWRSSDAFGGYPTFTFHGKVINKKKLLIHYPGSIVSQTEKARTVLKPDTLYYQYFNAKPDSTNNFIKY